MRRALSLLATAVLAAGCGGGKTAATTPSGATTTPTATTSTQAETRALELYYLAGDGKLIAVQRAVPRVDAVGAQALTELAKPSGGVQTSVPSSLALAIANGDATVTGADLSPAAEAQVVYTLTQFPTVKSVNGKTRADVEDYVPAILVEHPTAGETVTSPLRVTGNANTFEATFQYELRDANGAVLSKHFEMATSGSGTRGTFDFTVPFTVDAGQDGTLVVYENSAADGSVIHQRTIPLRLTP